MLNVLARLVLVLTILGLGARPVHAGEINLDAMTFGDQQPGLSGFAVKEKPLLLATLVPESPEIRPDAPFKVLLELNHLSGAYTYWTNPGGPGVSTEMQWSLPPGFSVSTPQWPMPERYENGGIVSHIHKGKVAAVFTVTPPQGLKPGQAFTLSGEVATQVCTPRSCNPIRIPVKTNVVVAENAGAVDPDFEKAVAAVPSAPRRWRFEASQYDDELVIAMYPRPGSTKNPEGIHFFESSNPAIVDSQRPQTLEKEGGVWWLRVPLLSKETKVGGRVAGVLRSDDGWLESDAGAVGLAIDLPIGSEDSGRPPGLQRAVRQDTALLLFFAFFGGLLLNIMPCVFPVIGLKIMSFAKQAHKERRAVFLHGLAYTAGVLLCFWTLSFLVITMGRGWGAQLQSDWFMFALCHVFMIMSMNMAGVFDINAGSGAGQSLTGREGIKRSFLTGLLATITSTPCSAPFLGTALAYALSLPPLLSLGVFTLMGLGFSFPYLALSLFPGWLKRLPKPGQWMETFRQAMCFPLFATTAYLFWTMEAMLTEWHFLMLLFGLVLTAMACWLYGRSQKSHAKSRRAGRVTLAFAVLSLAAGIWLGMPRAKSALEWSEWSPETVTRLREEGRPVYVDFTARWCATCQLNKRIYMDPELARLMEEKNVALLKADWTQYDDRITSTLKNEFNKAAVPVTVLYVPGERRASVLPDILTVATVAEALQALP